MAGSFNGCGHCRQVGGLIRIDGDQSAGEIDLDPRDLVEFALAIAALAANEGREAWRGETCDDCR